MLWREWMAECDPHLVDATMEHGVRRAYKRRQVVFREGDPNDGMYLVESGRFLVETTTVEGAPVGLDVIDPGGIVGEQSLIHERAVRNATVTALRDAEVILIRPRAFRELRESNPQIDRFLLMVLDGRLREMSERLAEAVHATAEDRVRSRLSNLALAYDGSIRMSQQTLAGLAGTTRPTVNRVLRELEDEGVVSLGRSRVQVIDLTALTEPEPLSASGLEGV